MRIALSPSDQFRNLYAAGGTTERDQMRRVVAVAAADLRAAGHEVLVCTRGDGQDDSYVQHAHEANAWRAGLYVAVHSNAGGGHGTETHCMGATASPQGYRLACALQARVGAVSSAPDRGVKASPGLAEVWIPDAPAALVETAFHDDATEAKELIAKAEEFGHAVALAVIDVAGRPAVRAVPVLQLGSTGPDVKTWQAWLMSRFPDTHGAVIAAHGGADGDYGAWTVHATRDFQTAATVDGNYRDARDGKRGPNTIAAAHVYGYRGA